MAMHATRSFSRIHDMSLLEGFRERVVLVVGDVMLDEYAWGDVRRISPEAPVPIVEIRSRTHAAGGAANAAANIVSLGGQALLGGMVGWDSEAQALRDELTKRGVEAYLVRSEERPTTTKSRVIAGSQQILRIDREVQTPISDEVESFLLEWARRSISSIDGVLISDYGKGVVTHRLCRTVIDLARAEGKPVVVDPKGRDYSKYQGATVVTPNAMEVRLAAEPLSVTAASLEDHVARLQSVLNGTYFLVTRGPAGVSLFRPDGSVLSVAAKPRNVFDVTGAGDTFVAALALSLAAGATIEEATSVANIAAGLVITKVGTATVGSAELDAELQDE
jgi:D-beta-D-heptose 7-phosphate kinase/D-beta-D-heptose 1-phosphate adenosyltransferase